MRDVFALAATWLQSSKSFALATLVATRDACPAPVGTTMAVDGEGHVAGNIGAGCHDAEIVEACTQTLRDARTRSLTIGLTEDDEIFGGAGCGGSLEIAVWRPHLAQLEDLQAIASGDRDVTLMNCEFPRRRPLIVVGATTLASEIAMLGKRLDFRVVVVDPRPAFATHARVPAADEIVCAWPEAYLPQHLNETTPIVVLSHDRKIDLPALRCALQSPAPYIGLLGSRRIQETRRAFLREDGFDETELARICGPAGLDLGGRTDAETATSILAEIVAGANGRQGGPLRARQEPIHGAVICK